MRLAKSIDFSFFHRNKRGSALETHEPSSPKVTCIGQVRVKSKKKPRHRRSLSKRRNLGEVSFRKGEDRHHQKWVHLPISLVKDITCCLFPCCNLCAFSKKTKCCGCRDVFGRLLVWVSDCDCGRGQKKEIEEVVSVRRHAFDDIEVKDGRIQVNGECLEEEVGRVSICIPPKNALLLMRCRSDPMKMAALANRISWAHSSNVVEEEEEMNEQEEEEEVESNMSSFEALLSQQEPYDANGKNDEEMTEETEEEPSTKMKIDADEKVLPDCLVLMMREPKLSMEVSKETWVHGADFIKCLPPRKPPKPAKPACCHHELLRRRPNPDPKPKSVPKKIDHQPPRSSCSLPNAATPNTDQFMLTRCKSVPMRTAAAKLLPDLSTGEPGISLA